MTRDELNKKIDEAAATLGIEVTQEHRNELFNFYLDAELYSSNHNNKLYLHSENAMKHEELSDEARQIDKEMLRAEPVVQENPIVKKQLAKHQKYIFELENFGIKVVPGVGTMTKEPDLQRGTLTPAERSFVERSQSSRSVGGNELN
jgi:hypothetical protein